MASALSTDARRDGPGAYLSGLYVYPIKSCGGIPLKASEVDGRGLRYDRRWMLVDEADQFMSQRRLPRMALIEVRLERESLVVDAPGMPSLEMPLRPRAERLMLVRVLEDLVEASPVSDDAHR